MRFSPTALVGAYVVDVEPHADERGFFARTFCAQEFVERGLEPTVAQCGVAHNRARGTLRGMHYQAAPAAEAKLVRCTAGAILDVAVDLRHGPTYLRHVAVELSAANRRALYVPRGFAHGYQTLADGAEVAYQMSEAHAPACARGLRHDDPALGIAWPLPVAAISERDRTWPLLGTDASA